MTSEFRGERCCARGAKDRYTARCGWCVHQYLSLLGSQAVALSAVNNDCADEDCDATDQHRTASKDSYAPEPHTLVVSPASRGNKSASPAPFTASLNSRTAAMSRRAALRLPPTVKPSSS